MSVFAVFSDLIGVTLALLSYSHFTIDPTLFIWILCHKVLLTVIKERGSPVVIPVLFLIIQISLPQCNLAELLHSVVELESPFFFLLVKISFFILLVSYT